MKNGYAQMRGYERTEGAHRFAHKLLIGPIPDGYDIDHTCRIRLCMRHLEAVPRGENCHRENVAVHGPEYKRRAHQKFQP
jgi:hypothetical protein